MKILKFKTILSSEIVLFRECIPLVLFRFFGKMLFLNSGSSCSITESNSVFLSSVEDWLVHNYRQLRQFLFSTSLLYGLFDICCYVYLCL